MTFPEYIAANATWFDRLACRFGGHDRSDKPAQTARHPCEDGQDFREQEELRTARPYCYRCGADLRSVVKLFAAVASGELTPEQASAIIVRRRP